MWRGEPGAWPREAQRREEKRAEARLAGGLQRLDEARLYHLKTLAREQRRLQRDLGAIRSSNPWRKTIQSLGSRPWDPDLNHPTLSYKRTFLPIIPRGGQDPEKQRSQKPKSGGVGGSSAGLQARVREFMGAGDPRVESSTAPLCLPDLKVQNAARLSPTGKVEEGETERKERGPQREGERCFPSPPPPAEATALDSRLAPDGRLRTVHTLPSFSQALAEARKARYIRHRGRPLCERELSVREIFARTPKDTNTH
ncbi:coiled-coil domain-containing protein 190 [Megalops cyprinoides]|uniref:coiled-coil domain-containing protein 190 n=1 Tax=Megalops cyprinoides TaxID=118141 RepID=UPI0018653CB7|nr:coiled-coil domain-containing protein 190 [Megalops cyprinoides]